MNEPRRVAMISGASRGLGHAIVQDLLARGWCISAGMRNPVVPDHPDCLVCPYDALQPQTGEAWLAATLAHFGRVDGLVLNAGIHSSTPVLEAGMDELDRLLEVNLKAPLRLAQTVWPALVAPPVGRIVVISSLSGKRIKSRASGLYGISKHAVSGLAAALRQEGRDCGLRVTEVCPSFIATDMGLGAAGGRVDSERLTRPEDVARIVGMALELPPSASVSTIPVHYDVEDCF
ncbi:MAG: hypothetical protein BGP11_16170 [Rhodobacterales bacterium 65-51]|uniref:SDR family NAD(P)-dependent oxidoreductase n=1 Tax=uncultured Gemmobacter sp. TaxID=1095917 RepID=UPI0009686D4F|nr:SDR family NAD(P)-dependent oxidoreductase [uncultured Gemmobacter sp.]OJY34824.1 MAG: hypothetical protein BGP11_16170 [Rhodobacterales bacterium 65-51]